MPHARSYGQRYTSRLKRPEWTVRSKPLYRCRGREDAQQREATDRYLGGRLSDGRARDVPAEAIADAEREARTSGFTDEEIEAERQAWRVKRKT